MDGSSAEIALRLLTVGMASVFTILGLVAMASRGLILLTNRLAVEEPAAAMTGSERPRDDTGITDEEMAVIAAAVHLATEGKGQTISVNRKADKVKV